MAEETAGSIGMVVRDLVRAAILIVGTGIVEGLKRWLFHDDPPILLVATLNIGELTLLISFLIAFVAAFKQLWRVLMNLWSGRGKPVRAAKAGQASDSVAQAARRGVVSAASLGMGVGMYLCLLLAAAYLLALTGSMSATVYYVIIGAGAVVVLISIGFAVAEYKAMEQAESGAGVFLVIAAFMVFVIGGFTLITLANRYLLSGALDRLISFLLLRH